MEHIDHPPESDLGEQIPVRGNSLNLPLCDVRIVLSDEQQEQLERDLAGLAAQRRLDAATILSRTDRI